MIYHRAEVARVLVEEKSAALKKRLEAEKDMLECQLARAEGCVSFVGRCLEHGSDKDIFESCC